MCELYSNFINAEYCDVWVLYSNFINAEYCDVWTLQ